MQVLDTQHKRKSAVITAVILLLFLLWIFNSGMKYIDPPVEYGLAINFGNSELGNGEPVENTKTASQSKQEVVEEQQEEASEEKLEEVIEDKVEDTQKETIKEEVITEDTSKEVPVVKKAETKKAELLKETPKKTEPKKEKPKPSKATTDALNSLLKGNSSERETKGEGDDDQSGLKGSENGDPNSDKYYGNSGSGSGGNYNLAGRKALSKPIQKPDCQEEGTVVVSIEVDNNGKVIKAIPGVKGSTNTSPCLLEPAKQAALKTKWNADLKAPIKQKGTIIYKFSLSK